MENNNYFKDLEFEIKKVYNFARIARKKCYDPKDYIEVSLALSMAEKVVNLISTIYPQIIGVNIEERILELENQYGKLNSTVVFKIAEEIARQNFCKFDSELEAMDAGIRVGFAYITLGVVSSPIEGFTGLKLRKTIDGKNYVEASFSGPIRSAGTTASCLVLILIDFLREIFGYDKYDPTEEEISRVVCEINDFNDRVANLQYLPTDEEIIYLMKNIPIQIAGEPSEKKEVSNYKNLKRVDTNNLRSGFCLIFSEGLAQKAAKGFRLLEIAKKNGINANGFNFLGDYVEIHKKRNNINVEDSTPVYIKDIVGGRPVFSHPSESGGFRFRYGRSRVSGFSSVSVNPATMSISDNFIATGTQLKIEKPTKGCVTTPCDSIDGPIVKLKNGSLRKIKTREEGKKIFSEVEEIVYIGDILFPFSDILNRNENLINPGFVEEWWKLLLPKNEVIDEFNLSLNEAINFSERFNIPLNPKFIFYWTQIDKLQFLDLIKWLNVSKFENNLILNIDKNFSKGKRALELLGVEFEVSNNSIIIKNEIGKSLLINLGIDDLLKIDFNRYNIEGSVLDIVNKISKFKIKDKAGSFIGARMGRPEKSKLRKLPGSPNVLFPIGNFGGRLKSIQEAVKKKQITGVFHNYFCDNCKKNSIYPYCVYCGNKAKELFYCYDCGKNKESFCEIHKRGKVVSKMEIDIEGYFKNSCDTFGEDANNFLKSIKGVSDLSSKSKIPENLVKGFLRSKHNLSVNKDGTVRVDSTELSLVSFKPKEIGTSIEKLRELGYNNDIFGKELLNENQIVELMPHDILIPDLDYSLGERGGDIFIKICNFIDDELKYLYKMEPFYNVKEKKDLIGKIGVCIAPHNCAGVACRFIGFSQTLGVFANPYLHAAVRRDCDGDELSIMLLGDVLLNFSKEYLPSHRGGTQDAPLVLNARIDAGEVDDQILDFEMLGLEKYPLELYELAEKGEHSSKVNIKTIKDVLKLGENAFSGYGFTHDTSDFNSGVNCSSYKIFPTMKEKVEHQMALVEKIRAVNSDDVARLIIERHFLGDILGNFRKFLVQEFRCVECNSIIRRPPLSGVCNKCGGKLIFTVNEGGIKKYLKPAIDLSLKYNVSEYLRENLRLVKEQIDSVFGEDSA